MIKGYYLFCPLLGLLLAINGLAIQHDANHGSFSKNKRLNGAAQIVNDFIGGSSLMWRHQHVIGHHAYPNINELDADTFSNFPIMKLNPGLPSNWYNAYQHIYGPILYSFLGIAYAIGDIFSYMDNKYINVPLQPLRPIDKIIFIAGKISYFSLFVLVPIYLYGFAGIWKYYLPMVLVGSNFLASLFAVSHNTHETEYNLDPNSDWAEIQIRTAANWSIHSTAWWLVSGGLNFQIEHHLFPGISHVHYPAISKIVRQICKEKKIPYNHYPTYYEIYTNHLSTLKKLGHYKSV